MLAGSAIEEPVRSFKFTVRAVADGTTHNEEQRTKNERTQPPTTELFAYRIRGITFPTTKLSPISVMTVEIVQVVNNTAYTLYYHNTESGHGDTVYAKSQDQENKNNIPSSNYYNDTLPYSSADNNKFLELTLDSYGPIKVQDDNWRFKVTAPVDYEKGNVEKSQYGSLDDLGKYIIRVDTVQDGYNKYCSLTILKYEDKYKVTAGYIASQLIQQAAPIVALVLLAIFI